MVRAPAGYGKTSQVATWAANDGRPVEWADLEPADNDPEMLVQLLGTLLRSIADADLDELLGVRTSTAQYPLTVGPVLVHALRRCEQPFVLVLDDIHVIEDGVAADLIGVLLSNVPAGSTVVIIGRREPNASLTRLRVDGRVVEITADELALTVPEAWAVFESIGVGLDEDEVCRYVEETEGWPVGLRLAALALREGAGHAAASPTGPLGRDRIVAEYVHEEWLRGLPADDMEFLLRVSGIEWLSGELCDSALGRSDSGDRLKRLHRDRLVVVPLDRRGDAYRMHALLREVLDAEFERVDREGRRKINLQASEWFEGVGDIDRAVRHAARAGDRVRVARLVRNHAPTYHANGRYTTVGRWLDSFPPDHLTSNPSLCLIAALTSMGLGKNAESHVWLRLGEQALRSMTAAPTDPTVEFEILTLRATLSTGPVVDALADVSRAYEELPAGFWHSGACQTLGALSFAIGHDDVAESALMEGVAEARVVGATSLEATCRAHLAVMLGEHDDWDGATAMARAARRLLREHDLDNMPTLILATAMSALVEAMAGDPETARADLLLTRRNMAYVSAIAGWINIQARLALARTCLLLSDRVGARVFLDETEAYLRAQPDATRPREQLAALVERLDTAHGALPVGPMALTTAELRVLHLLPTNLTIAEIAGRLYVSAEHGQIARRRGLPQARGDVARPGR